MLRQSSGCTSDGTRPANSPSPAAGEVRWGFSPDAERPPAVPTRSDGNERNAKHHPPRQQSLPCGGGG